MKTYFICLETATVYSDNEKNRSKYGPDRFERIGEAKNREEAEQIYYEKTGVFPAVQGRRF